jgi:hypothetical protein
MMNHNTFPPNLSRQNKQIAHSSHTNFHLSLLHVGYSSTHNLPRPKPVADWWIRSPDRPSRSELLYRMIYPGLPTVASIVRKCRETTHILALPFDVVIYGNKTVTQQLAGKQQVLSHVTLVAAIHEPALEWPLMYVRASD